MRKMATLGSVLLAITLLLSCAGLALADGDISGTWSGTWNDPQGQIKSGSMHGTLKQSGSSVSGTFYLQGTIVGDISGPLNGAVTGNSMWGDINAGGNKIHLSGTISGNSISGSFGSAIGDGSFKINKQ